MFFFCRNFLNVSLLVFLAIKGEFLFHDNGCTKTVHQCYFPLANKHRGVNYKVHHKNCKILKRTRQRREKDQKSLFPAFFFEAEKRDSGNEAGE